MAEKPYDFTMRLPMSAKAHALTDKVLALPPADLAAVKLAIDLAFHMYTIGGTNIETGVAASPSAGRPAGEQE